MSPTQPAEPPLDEAESEHERDDDDDPEDDDPRVTLDLTGLPLPEPQTRPHGLEADRVHGAVDDPTVEPVAPSRDHDSAAAHAVHDAVDDLAVEPVKGPSCVVDDRPTERVVRVIDPVALREHAVNERPAPRGG